MSESIARQDRTRQDKTRQDKTRQDKTRQDKTRRDRTRQDKTIDTLYVSSLTRPTLNVGAKVGLGRKWEGGGGKVEDGNKRTEDV